MQFDERVVKAVETLWITQKKEEANEAREQLKEAAREGNAEANYFLARCYAGPSFVNKAYGFDADDKMAYQYLEKSMELGSPLGMMGARWFSDFRPYKGSYVYPPYNSDREIWDAIIDIGNEQINSVTIFCKYMIGNAYYYGDVVELSEFPAEQVEEETVKAFMLEAANYYEDCLRAGGGFAAGNLINIFENGNYIPKDPARVMKYKEMAADLNVGKYMIDVGDAYLETDVDKAEGYYTKAGELGYALGFSKKMKLYTFGGKRETDIKKAMEIGEKGLEIDPEQPGIHNYLGEIYFRGGEGVEVDYYKAVEYFERAYTRNNWCADLLGTCNLRGWGTEVNYERARSLFLEKPSAKLSLLGLGEIYCFGLGVNQDIAKGMEYLDKKSADMEAEEMKSYFKKGLFGGKWKQIKDYKGFNYK